MLPYTSPTKNLAYILKKYASPKFAELIWNFTYKPDTITAEELTIINSFCSNPHEKYDFVDINYPFDNFVVSVRSNRLFNTSTIKFYNLIQTFRKESSNSFLDFLHKYDTEEYLISPLIRRLLSLGYKNIIDENTWFLLNPPNFITFSTHLHLPEPFKTMFIEDIKEHQGLSLSDVV